MDRYIADLLITMSDDHPAPLKSGVVDVENGRVVWSGPASESPPRADVTIHRIEGILMPGMVNIHCHTPMVLLRGAGEGLPVDRWLREVMWPREAKLTPDDVRVGMQMGAAELLSNGVTTSVEMYFYPHAIAEGANAAGLRCIVTPPVIEDEQLPKFGTWQAQLDEMVSAQERWSSNDDIEIGIGPHSAGSVSEVCLRRIADLAAETGMLVHIHVSEHQQEGVLVRKQTGHSAASYLESIGLLQARVLAAHSVWMSDDDIEIFARNDVSVAHCPCSNSKHASGVARVDDMLSAGIRMGIATDGPASHHRLDLFEEMRMAIRLARIHHGNADLFPAARALRMVTAGAADAIGHPDLGRLQPGSRADMVAISKTAPALNPVISQEDDPISRIVWSGSPSAISAVWVGGRKVVDKGRVTTMDLDELASEMTERAQRLAS
jgi:5-methylthioadenosine/S-adenosylhomocysteine deaminase